MLDYTLKYWAIPGVRYLGGLDIGCSPVTFCSLNDSGLCMDKCIDTVMIVFGQRENTTLNHRAYVNAMLGFRIHTWNVLMYSMSLKYPSAKVQMGMLRYNKIVPVKAGVNVPVVWTCDFCRILEL